MNKKIKLFFAILVILNAADALTTYIAIDSGQFIELNPIAMAMWNSFGFELSLFMKLLTPLGLFVLYRRMEPNVVAAINKHRSIKLFHTATFAGVIGLYSCAAVNNTALLLSTWT